jgi:tetratricopeptide (TPR) repeat protein
MRDLKQVGEYYHEILYAYQTYKRSISVAFIHRSLGDVLSEQGRFDDSREHFMAAIEGLQGSERYKNEAALTLSAYAGVLEKLGRMEEALASYNEAVNLLPNASFLLRNRAETLIQLRRLSDAEADLARGVELDGNEESPYLWLHRAHLAIVRGDSPLADQMLEEVAKRNLFVDEVKLLHALSAWLSGDLKTTQDKLMQVLHNAKIEDRAAISRIVERLLDENPKLAGSDTIRELLNKSLLKDK